MNKVLELKNITKKYNNKIIIEDFNLDINEGEYVVLIGESGCGKTTLLSIMGLLETFDAGQVYINGEEIHSTNKKNEVLRNYISFVFQNYGLIDNQTVRENMKIAAKFLKISNKEKQIRIEVALDKVGLVDAIDKKVYQLSGGEQQRIAIARLLLKPTSMILADEPTGNLDDDNKQIVMDLLERFHKDGKTVVVATHDKAFINRADRVIRIGKHDVDRKNNQEKTNNSGADIQNET